MPSKIFKVTQIPKTTINNQNSQSGFTLIEMLVAISVFAMLSVAGWQVFEGLTRTKSSTNVHAKALSSLQYAYLQVQNDLNQITAWQTKQNDAQQENSNQNNANEPSASYNSPKFFQLSSAQLSFIRYADPDPRYQTSPTLMQVAYVMDGDKLIRQQHFDLDGVSSPDSSSHSLDSVLITGVTNVNFEALNPDPISEYPSVETDTQQSNNNPDSNRATNKLLPKGLVVTFNYRDEPIEWVFALPTESPEINSHYQIAKDKEDGDDPTKKNDTDDPNKQDDTDKKDDNNKKDDNKQNNVGDKISPEDYEDEEDVL